MQTILMGSLFFVANDLDRIRAMEITERALNDATAHEEGASE